MPERSTTSASSTTLRLRKAVAAAAHRQRQGVVAGEVDGRGDILGVGGPHDRCRAGIVEDGDRPAGLVVASAAGCEKLAGKAAAKLREWIACDCDVVPDLFQFLDDH